MLAPHVTRQIRPGCERLITLSALLWVCNFDVRPFHMISQNGGRIELFFANVALGTQPSAPGRFPLTLPRSEDGFIPDLERRNRLYFGLGVNSEGIEQIILIRMILEQHYHEYLIWKMESGSLCKYIRHLPSTTPAQSIRYTWTRGPLRKVKGQLVYSKSLLWCILVNII